MRAVTLNTEEGGVSLSCAVKGWKKRDVREQGRRNVCFKSSNERRHKYDKLRLHRPQALRCHMRGI